MSDFITDANMSLLTLADELEKIGVYPENFSLGIQANDPSLERIEEDADILDMMRQGQINVVIGCELRTGNVAFSDRVLNPVEHSQLEEMRKMVGTEEEVGIEIMAEDLGTWDSDW